MGKRYWKIKYGDGPNETICVKAKSEERALLKGVPEDLPMIETIPVYIEEISKKEFNEFYYGGKYGCQK
jgi:hypothetical protein